MGAVIFRGSTPTIRMRPTNGMNVADLGEPTVAIAQEIAYIEKTGEDVVVDTSANAITVTLTEADTLSLAANAETRIQQVWKTANDEVVRFPEHALTVASTLVESVLETPEPPEDEPDYEPEVLPDNVAEDVDDVFEEVEAEYYEPEDGGETGDTE